MFSFLKEQRKRDFYLNYLMLKYLFGKKHVMLGVGKDVRLGDVDQGKGVDY